MSGHDTYKIANQPFEYYGGPEWKGQLETNDSHVPYGAGKGEHPNFEENTKFIGKPVFPAELPFDSYTTISPISQRTLSSTVSTRNFTQPSSPASRFEPLIERQPEQPQELPSASKKPRMKYIIGGVTLLLVVIVAAVVGGVLAAKQNKSSVASVTGGISANSTSSSNSTSNPSSTTSTIPANSTRAPFQRNVAAVSYTENSVNNTRVYYQDNLGNIIEAVNSASSETWSTSQIVSAKNGSALAAAVTKPENSFEITLIYTDSNDLLHDIRYDTDSKSWSEGTLSAKNYIVAPYSKLAVMYWDCYLCTNTTIIAFQDVNNNLQVGNLTSSGWTLNQMNVDCVVNTGIALQPFYRLGQADQINLYYTTKTGNLTISAWEYTTGAWRLDAAHYYYMVQAAPIAASASYTNVTWTGDVKTGFESWGETLILSGGGIKVNTYSGLHNDWAAMGIFPSVMANSTNNVKEFKSVAATAIGSAFAVVGVKGKADVIESYQVQDDTINWDSAGTVDIGGIWG